MHKDEIAESVQAGERIIELKEEKYEQGQEIIKLESALADAGRKIAALEEERENWNRASSAYIQIVGNLEKAMGKARTRNGDLIIEASDAAAALAVAVKALREIQDGAPLERPVFASGNEFVDGQAFIAWKMATVARAALSHEAVANEVERQRITASIFAKLRGLLGEIEGKDGADWTARRCAEIAGSICCSGIQCSCSTCIGSIVIKRAVDAIRKEFGIEVPKPNVPDITT